MRSIGLVLSLLLLAFVAAPDRARAAQAGAVEVDGRVGKAVVFRASGRCLGLTAGHVVGDASAGTIRLQGAPNQSLRFSVLDNKEDIALVQVAIGELTRLCSDDFFPAQPLQRLLDTDTRAQIRILDGDRIGTIGGSVVGYDSSLSELQLQPYDRNDPRMERGISGGLILLQGNPIAIITDVRGVGINPEALAVPLDRIRRLFSTFLPQPRSTRTYGKYDISWMPREFREVMETIKRSITDAEDVAERARNEASLAKLQADRASVLPESVDGILRGQSYRFPSVDGESEYSGQVKTGESTTPGRVSVIYHGLGSRKFSAGSNDGRVFTGRFADQSLRLGLIRNDVTPSRPEGRSFLYAAWNEDGTLLAGEWHREDKRVFLGKFKNNNLTSGRMILNDLRRLDASWPENGGRPTGPCVYWNEDGSFHKGGYCNEDGGLDNPLIQP